MPEKFNLGTAGAIIGLVIFVAIVVTFQFYDVVLIKKNLSTPQKSTANIEGNIEDQKYNIDPASLNVSMDDLTEEELIAASSFLRFQKLRNSVIPTGIPAIYGEELDVSFDQVQDAIDKIQVYGPTYGKQKIVLTGKDLERFINIASRTSCEHCCGVTTLVREDGGAACGCAHSIMMRGLTAYLIKNHSSMSDDEILYELNAWKATFFPKQSIGKALAEMKANGDSSAEEIIKDFPDLMPDMVGGC